ncbi:hypothetical protein AgCh_003778 [Apium graveolens]
MPKMATTEVNKTKEGAVSLSYPMLAKCNYTAWALRMKVFMQAHDVWDAVESKDDKIEVDDRTDKIALDAIYQGIPEDILLSVADKKTAKQAWEAVKTMCLGADRVKKARVQTLKAEFESLSMKDSEPLDDFCMKMKGLVINIRALGENVEENYVVKKLLRAVPQKFLQIASTIEQFGNLEIMTVEEAVGSLKDHEERLRCNQVENNGGQLMLTEEEWEKRESEEKKLLLTRDEWVRRGNRGGNNGNRTRDSSRGGRDKSKVKCFGCGLYGHYAAECRKSRCDKDHKDQKQEVNMALVQDDEPALLLTECEKKEDGVMLLNEERVVPRLSAEEKQIESNLWYLDNGASNHMIGHRSKFSELDEKVTGQVKFGDGSIVHIKGKGSIVLQCKNGEERTLQEVYYIPTLRSNIISLGQISECGNEVVLKGEYLWVRDKQGKLIMKVKRSMNRLYKIILETNRLQPNIVHVSRDVEFKESKSWLWELTEQREIMKLQTFTVANVSTVQVPVHNEENTRISGTTNTGHTYENINDTNSSTDSSGDSSSETSSEPLRYRSLRDVYEDTEEIELEEELYLMGIDEPSDFNQASKRKEWRDAMDKEMQAVEKNQTWSLVELPPGQKPIGLKWVFKVKKDSDGKVGIDFEEIFAPVTRIETVRLLLALAAKNEWEVHYLDVKIAFLNGEIKEEVYVNQPEGYAKQGQEHMVYKLSKPLYELRQAPRAWYSKLNKCLLDLGFERCPYQHAIYTRRTGGETLIVGVYVDDLLVTGTSKMLIERFKTQMGEFFEMSDLGQLSYYLGIEVEQGAGYIKLKQTGYGKKILEKAGLKDCNPVNYPMDPKECISKDEGGKPVNTTQFKSLVGGLRYLVHKRPDIAYSVGIVSRFMENPTVMHLNAAKRILWYIKGTLDLGLIYTKEGGNNVLTRYSNSDLGGFVDDRRSTGGMVFYLNERMVTWVSQKQMCVALSSCEVEFMAATTAASQAIWLRKLLSQVTDEYIEPVIIYIDNMSAIDLVKNPMFHGRSKHIDIRYHFIREYIERGEIIVQHVSTVNQKANILTKALTTVKFERMRRLLGVQELIKQS